MKASDIPAASSGPEPGAAQADPIRTQPPPEEWKTQETGRIAWEVNETKYPPEIQFDAPEIVESEEVDLEVDETDLLSEDVPPPELESEQVEVRKNPPPLPRLSLIPPPVKTIDLPRSPAVLDFSDYDKGTDSEPPISIRELSKSGVESVRGSSFSTQTHLQIEEKLHAKGFKIRNTGAIDLPILQSLASLLIHGYWVSDEQKRRLAMIEYLERVKPDWHPTAINQDTQTLENLFILELKRSKIGEHVELARRLSAKRHGRKPPPASSNG